MTEHISLANGNDGGLCFGQIIESLAVMKEQ